ncbi:MAG: farnesyl diphosphate synthase [Planctomycetota bacterium]
MVTVFQTDIDETLAELRAGIDRELAHWLPDVEVEPRVLHQAMHYAVFPGGKRLRPALMLLTCRAAGGAGADERALPAAAALELIHCYSLVHDDLPCMDDDELRRGRPTCHVAFGEANALLAADALLTLAFEVIGASPLEPAATVRLQMELARAAGSLGMVGGQVLDLLGSSRAAGAPGGVTRRDVEQIHLRKTAALFAAAAKMGAIAAQADESQILALQEYGRMIGLGFQIVDDLLDIAASTTVLGKTAGKDQAQEKLTYPSVCGVEEARREVHRLTEKAKGQLHGLPFSSALGALADKLALRVS